MKTFKYRWKIGDKEYEGTHDAENRNYLEAHIKTAGGELIEILEESKKTEVSKNEIRNTKKCPFCGEEILAEAIKCKHCKESLLWRNEESRRFTHASESDPYRPPRGGNNGLAITSFILGILGIITSAIGIGFLLAVIAVCLGPGGRDSKYSALASWGMWLGWIVIIGSILVGLFWFFIFGLALSSSL